MQSFTSRALCAASFVLSGLAGCNGHSGPVATSDSIQVTPSISGRVAVVVGGSQTLSVAFNSSDGRTLSSLAVTGGLMSLPAGWSGPDQFACASVSTGGGCLLDLSYKPAAAATGSFTIAFSYMNNAGAAETGSVLISYLATTADNVVGAASPAGQVNAVVGSGSQSVGVTFTTDDGNPASTLTLNTDLSKLPVGWSSASSSFTCSSVSTGNGCHLGLLYAPTAVGSGNLTLDYSYFDDSHAAKTGSVTIPYRSTEHDNVVAALSPSGQVAGVAGGTQTVSIAFTTDDGHPASALAVTAGLTTLPAGWSAAAPSFTCAAVSTGNGCHLSLTFAPTAATSGTVMLSYGYTDNAGTAKTGSVSIPYTSTAHDNVLTAVSPTGQVAGITGGTQIVRITFTTDDGNPASALAVSTDLTMLPSGWSSSASSFTCGAVSTGNGCRLPLTFAPTSAGSGTLTLNFGYTDNAGSAKTGTVAISYTATAHDNVLTAVSPSGTILAALSGTQAVSVTFTTDDGSNATSLSLNSDLTTALPADWSSTATSFTCATVSTGSTCQLPLTFAPSAVESGSFQLNYGYTDNAGNAQTGSVTLFYSGTQSYLYVPNYTGDSVVMCAIASDASLGACQPTGSGFSSPEDIKISGQLLYVVNYRSQSVSVCTINADGTLSGCTATGTGFTEPLGMAINPAGTYAYVTSYSQSPSVCAIDPNGLFTNCALTGNGESPSWGFALSADGTLAYYTSPWNSDIDTCVTDPDGTLSSCTIASTPADEFGLTLNGTHLYEANLGNGSVDLCALNLDGTIGNCMPAGSNFPQPIAVVLNGSFAYVSNYSSNSVSICPVNADGTFGTCTLDSDPSFSFPFGIAVH